MPASAGAFAPPSSEVFGPSEDDAQWLNRRLGFLKGKLVVPEDFDAPLPDDVLSDFEGGR